ncbi:MAG: hypothetical protein ACRC1K_20125, partial [Planctomycetia bacterium]
MDDRRTADDRRFGSTELSPAVERTTFLAAAVLAAWAWFAADLAAAEPRPLMTTSPAPMLHPIDDASSRPLELLDAPAVFPPAPTAPVVEPGPRPEWLPRYTMDLDLDTAGLCGKVHEVVQWTNRASIPAEELVFYVYARHKPNEEQRLNYERTLESFRLSPRTAMDLEGRRIHLTKVTSGNVDLKWCYDAAVDTLLHVSLPKPVQPGETVEVTLDFTFTLPEVQGRFGRYEGVTTLVNWYPLVAYFDDNGWDAPPFVGWHQPWLNEAGRYTVRATIKSGETAAGGGTLVSTEAAPDGGKVLTYVGDGLRDFGLVVSKRFEVHEATVDGVRVQIYAFPEHRWYARFALDTAADTI